NINHYTIQHPIHLRPESIHNNQAFLEICDQIGGKFKHRLAAEVIRGLTGLMPIGIPVRKQCLNRNRRLLGEYTKV
ncbi:hypothetical protein BY996DRAFT_6445324, partial [Phakopsora pachyrhizi]